MKRVVLALVVAATAVSTSLVLAGPAHAAGFTVDSVADGPDAVPGDGQCSAPNGQCTLRAAVMEANALNRGASIVLGGGTYTLTVGGAGEDGAATGDIDLRSRMTITGVQGSTIVKAGSGFNDRIFDVPPGTSAAITINGLSIKNGAAPSRSHENGGGIRYLGSGSLKLLWLTVSGNSASGGSGGGLYASGASGSTLSMNVSTFSANSAQSNGGGFDLEGAVTATSLANLTISNNTAANGGGLAAFVAPGATGTIESMSMSTVSGNHAAVTGAGGGLDVARAYMGWMTISGNSAGYGGGMQIVGSTAPVTMIGRSHVQANTATLSGGGVYATGCGASCGSLIDTEISGNRATLDGGGLFVSDGLTLSGVTIATNRTLGAGVNGGGLYHKGAAANPLKATNVTVTGNKGGPTSAGAVFATKATDVLTNWTFYNNAGGRANSIAVVGTGAKPQLRNTILDSAGLNCLAAVTSLGHNLESGSSCGLTKAGDLRNTDPQLIPLGDHGGPTETVNLGSRSPAIDAGDNKGCPQWDQRVVTRPQDGDSDGTATCDIGAIEAGDWYRNSEVHITNAGSPDPVTPGHNVTYTIGLSNTSHESHSITSILVDQLPADLSFVSCTATGGGVCGGAGNRRTVTFAAIAIGATPTVTIVARLSSSTQLTKISNTASISSDNPDTMSADNVARATVKVQR
jgi:uncharacterized repeat protein (TIGR01451 family)/CSLREA domain-containing protein